MNRLHIAGCRLLVWCNDDDDIMKWAPFPRVWMNYVSPCHSLGFLGFVMEPNIPVEWLSDRKWVRCLPHTLVVQPSHFTAITPSTLWLTKHPPHLLPMMTSEQIAGCLGNPCLGPCYLDRLIKLPLERSQSRHMRPVCVFFFHCPQFLSFPTNLWALVTGTMQDCWSPEV